MRIAKETRRPFIDLLAVVEPSLLAPLPRATHRRILARALPELLTLARKCFLPVEAEEVSRLQHRLVAADESDAAIDDIIGDFIILHHDCQRRHSAKEANSLASRAKRSNMSLDVAQKEVRDYLSRHPRATRDDVASAIGCSTGLVSRTSAWRIRRAEKKARKRIGFEVALDEWAVEEYRDARCQQPDDIPADAAINDVSDFGATSRPTRLDPEHAVMTGQRRKAKRKTLS